MQGQYLGEESEESGWEEELESSENQEDYFTKPAGVTGSYSGVIQGQAYIIAGESK